MTPVKKIGGPRGKKIVLVQHNCHPPGAATVVKNWRCLSAEKRGDNANNLPQSGQERALARQRLTKPGHTGRQGCRGRALSPLQKKPTKPIPPPSKDPAKLRKELLRESRCLGIKSQRVGESLGIGLEEPGNGKE